MKITGSNVTSEYGGVELEVDMDLRDLFAAFALTLGEGVWPGIHLPANATEIAVNAYAVADAMLAQRESQGKGKRR